MSATISHKEAIKQAKNLTVPEQILKSISQVFQDAQSTYAGHRKHLTVLKTIQQRAFDLGFEDVFNMAFCRLINKVLPIKKAEIVADRVVKLVANFVASIQSDNNEAANSNNNNKNNNNDNANDEKDEEDDTLGSRFVNHFVHHLLRGIESKDKNVRYRVLHFLSLIMSGLGEIDEELYSTLVWEVHKRLFDKEPNVRLKAVLCLSRFQEEDADLDDPNSAVAKLLFVIQNDSSAEVRRAALLNLDKTEVTLPYLMERAKDVNSTNRKLVYSRIIKEIGDFRLLDRDIREKILTWGLKDREPLVQQATIKMFCQQWFENVNNDIMELLERLHLSHSKIADVAIKFFLENRQDLIAKIKFDEEFWTKLNVEASFLARMFYAHCLAHNMNDTIENNFPETTEFASLLTKYLRVRKSTLLTPENDDSVDEINFVIEQLLLISKDYDFGDEIGRREMLQALRMSFYDDLTDSQIKIALEVLMKISINEKDFCQMVSEIIIDIRDEDEEFNMDMDMDLETESEEELESYKAKINRATQCLSICQHMLELTHEPLRDNIPVTSLLDSVINPSIRSKIMPIREGGVKCLGLCCLLDETLATEQLAFFGICCAKGNEDLQITCLKIIFDILSTHGPKVLNVEGCVDTLSMHKLLFRSLRKFDRPRVQAVTAEGLCKLYLNDIFNDEELFETLILGYFSASNSQNEDLLQALSFCLPAYAFSHPKHQEKIAKVASDAFSRLYNLHEELLEAEENTETMPSPATIIQQLIYWTDPQNLVNVDDNVKDTLKHHYTFAYDVLELLSSDTASKAFRKVVATNLIKFNISEQHSYEDLNNLYDKAFEANDVSAESSDTPTRNALKRFLAYLEEVCNIAEEREKNMPKEKENDEEFVSALIGDNSDDTAGKEEQLEANFGEADENDLAIPDTSLRKIASNLSGVVSNMNSDDEEDQFEEEPRGQEGKDILELDQGSDADMKSESNNNKDEAGVAQEPKNEDLEVDMEKDKDRVDDGNNSSVQELDDTANFESADESTHANESIDKVSTKQKKKSMKSKKHDSKVKEEIADGLPAQSEPENESRDSDVEPIEYIDSGDEEDRVFKKPTLLPKKQRAAANSKYAKRNKRKSDSEDNNDDDDYDNEIAEQSLEHSIEEDSDSSSESEFTLDSEGDVSME